MEDIMMRITYREVVWVINSEADLWEFLSMYLQFSRVEQAAN